MKKAALLATLLVLSGCAPHPGAKAGGAKPTTEATSDEDLYNDAMSAKDAKVRVQKLETLYQRVGADPEKKDFVARLLVQGYAEVGDIDKMEKMAAGITIDEDYQGASVQNAMAYAYADKGLKLDQARNLVIGALNQLDKLETEGPPPQVDPEKFSGFIEQNRGYFLDTLGWIDHRSGKDKEAIAVLEEAARRVPQSTIYFHLGEAYKATGDVATASKDYAKAAAFDEDDSPKAKSALEDLEKQGKGVDAKALLSAAKAEHEKEVAKEKADLDARAAKDKVAREERMNAERDQAKKEALEDRLEKSAPTFAVSDLAGKKLDNTKLQKTVTVIDFWASWCGPCRLELPIYQTMFEKYKGKVQFVAISVDDTKDDATDYIKDAKFSFPVAYDPDAAHAFRVTGLPTLFVIGPCGNINWIHRGFNPQIEVILPAQIDQLLQETTASCDAKKPAAPGKDDDGDE
jgi:thiol-disulfide isomerase/thioredoxin